MELSPEEVDVRLRIGGYGLLWYICVLKGQDKGQLPAMYIKFENTGFNWYFALHLPCFLPSFLKERVLLWHHWHPR
jgi:hypothetical protein